MLDVLPPGASSLLVLAGGVSRRRLHSIVRETDGGRVLCFNMLSVLWLSADALSWSRQTMLRARSVGSRTGF